MGADSLSGTYDALVDEVKRAISLDLRRHGRVVRWVSCRLPPQLLPYLDRRGTRPARERAARRLSEVERTDPLFSVVTAPYFIEALARHVLSRFALTQEQVEALAKLHELRNEHQERVTRFFTLRPVRTALLAGVAIVATQLPKETFDTLGWSNRTYGWYRLALFTLLVIGIVGITLAVRWAEWLGPKDDPETAESRRVAHVTGLVLAESALIEHFPVFAPEDPAEASARG